MDTRLLTRGLVVVNFTPVSHSIQSKSKNSLKYYQLLEK
jgi:hypothetical protein